MLGGDDDEDDEIQELVRACRNQTETPRMRVIEDVRNAQEETARDTGLSTETSEIVPQHQPGPSGMFIVHGSNGESPDRPEQ